MTTTIKLATGRQTVWEITRGSTQQDNEFVDGLLYGGLFLLQQLRQHYFVQETKFPRSEDVYSSVDELKNKRDFLGHTYVPLAEAGVQTEDDIIPGYYTVWLRDPTEEGESNSVVFRSPAFLQGLFTALNAAGIPYHQVVLHKPVRNGQNFDIVGVPLPTLQEFAIEQTQLAEREGLVDMEDTF